MTPREPLHPSLNRIYAKANKAALDAVGTPEREAAVEVEHHWWAKLPPHVRAQIRDPKEVAHD